MPPGAGSAPLQRPEHGHDANDLIQSCGGRRPARLRGAERGRDVAAVIASRPSTAASAVVMNAANSPGTCFLQHAFATSPWLGAIVLALIVLIVPTGPHCDAPSHGSSCLPSAFLLRRVGAHPLKGSQDPSGRCARRLRYGVAPRLGGLRRRNCLW